VPPALLLAAGAIRPDPDTARSWVQRELSRREYHVSLLQRLSSWLEDLWRSLQASALHASPLSTAAAVVVAVVLVVLLVLVAGRVRREPARTPRPEADLGTGGVTARAHREAAETAAAAGDHGTAVVEAFRALAARAVEQGVLVERPGRTAHELAVDLGPVHPTHAEELERCSGLFDLVLYGGQPADRSDAEALLALDDALRASGPGATRLGAQSSVGAR
jgi:Domain of unknown function (DUF4129)